MGVSVVQENHTDAVISREEFTYVGKWSTTPHNHMPPINHMIDMDMDSLKVWATHGKPTTTLCHID